QVNNPVDYFEQRADGWTDVVTVVVVWAYSIGVTIVIAIVYFLLNRIPWLDNLGRKVRSKEDTKIENLIGHLSKLALTHEKDEDGAERWLLGNRAADDSDDD
ncbi:hypothetical protein LTR60_004660, partial [Cryomyces antarcticus]